MRSYKSLLVLMALCGCAHTQMPEPVSTTSWLDAFEPSGSFCLDAYMVNSAVHGCTEWSTRNISGIAEIRCVASDNPEDFWTSSTFIFFVPTQTNHPALSFEPLCGDMNGVLGILVPE
jgi:hypothetical protein